MRWKERLALNNTDSTLNLYNKIEIIRIFSQALSQHICLESDYWSVRTQRRTCGLKGGEMNVISAISVQMSAGLFSDKATELSNCFLLLVPW